MWAVSFAVTILITGTLSLTAVAQVTYSLEMDQDPVALGWTVFQNPVGGSHSVNNGVLMINTPGAYEFTAPHSIWQSVVNNATGWSIDTRFRVTSLGSNLGMTLWIHDNTELNVFNVLNDMLRLYGGVNHPDYVYPFIAGNDWHTYHLEGIGRDIDVWVDGDHVFDITHTALTGGTQGLIFGDGWFGGATVSEWDYFRFTVPLPEPAHAALLISLVIGIARRNRQADCRFS